MQGSWHLLNYSLWLHENVQLLCFFIVWTTYVVIFLRCSLWTNRWNVAQYLQGSFLYAQQFPFNKIDCWNLILAMLYCLSLNSFGTSLFLKGLKTSTEFPETSCWVSSVEKEQTYQTIKYWKKKGKKKVSYWHNNNNIVHLHNNKKIVFNKMKKDCRKSIYCTKLRQIRHVNIKYILEIKRSTFFKGNHQGNP